jgi:hypothetical protein
MEKPGVSRRDFLQAGATGVALASTFNIARAQNANDRIGVGFIGAGGRSGAHMSMIRHLRDRESMPIDLVAVCDVYRPRTETKGSLINNFTRYRGNSASIRGR